MKHFDQKRKENAGGAAKRMHNIMRDALRSTLLMQVPNHYTKGVMPLKLRDPFWVLGWRIIGCCATRQRCIERPSLPLSALFHPWLRSF